MCPVSTGRRGGGGARRLEGGIVAEHVLQLLPEALLRLRKRAEGRGTPLSLVATRACRVLPC